MAKRRRTRTRHPGVKVRSRTYASGTTSWFARWKDPTTGKEVDTNLTTLGLRTEKARVNWAIRKSQELQHLARSVSLGEVQPTVSWRMEAAVEDYLGRATERLEAITVAGYRASLRRFLDWIDSAPVSRLDELAPTHLAAYRDWLQRQKRKTAQSGGRRGERRSTDDLLSATTINHDLARVRVFLHEARRLGRNRHLDQDTISEHLKKVRRPRPRPEFLRPSQVRDLLEACLRHDRDTYSLTRSEKERGLRGGSVLRNDPSGPLVLFALLTGCRAGEIMALRWDYCHLSGKSPEIILPTAAVKTRHERSIDLAVSPTVVRLLEGLRLQSGGAPFVFGGDRPLSRTVMERRRSRLVKRYDAPPFTWQQIRQTCDTVLNNAPAIYGGGAAFLAAKRLGHSITVSEKHYAGLLRDLPKDAETIEACLGIEELAKEVIDRFGLGEDRSTSESRSLPAS